MDNLKLKALLDSLTGLKLNINRFGAEVSDEVKFHLEVVEQSRTLFSANVVFMAKASHPMIAESLLQTVIDTLDVTNIFFDDDRYQLVFAQPLSFLPIFEGELESNEFMYSAVIRVKIFKLEDEI